MNLTYTPLGNAGLKTTPISFGQPAPKPLAPAPAPQAPSNYSNVQTGTAANGQPILSSGAGAPPQGQTNALNSAGGIGSVDIPQQAPPTTQPAATTSPSDQYLQAYLESLKPSQASLDLQNQSSNLDAQSRNLANQLGVENANIETQAIPLQFMTGRQENLAKQYQLQQQGIQNQQQTVAQKLANEQAKRQSSIDVSKAMMDYGVKQQELSKPVFGGYGSVGYQINPKTGRYEPLDGGTGDMGGISNAITNGLLDPSQISRYNIGAIGQTINQDPNHNFVESKQALNNYTTYTKDAFGNIVPVQHFPGTSTGASGSSSTGYKAGQLTALLNSQGKPTDDASLAALYKSIGGQGNYTNDTAHNSQIYSALGGKPSTGGSSSSSSGGTTQFPAADAASLKKQQEYADSTQRAFNTANQNLQALIPFMKTAGVNNASDVPLINSLNNALKRGLTDAGTIAAYHAALAGLRAEYAQVLSRGGEVTEGQRAQASSLIPDDLTPVQLQQVANRLNIEGKNAVQEANAQIQTIKDRVNGKSSSSSPTDINALRTKYDY